MGCWNETCGLTQTPIRYGDDVAVYILIPRNNTRGATCHTDDFYNPFVLPIYGKYNDYGSIENIEDRPEYEAFYKLIHHYYHEKGLFECSKEDQSFSNIEEFIHLVERKYIRCKHNDLHVHLVMFHKHMHDHMISFIQDRKHDFLPKTYSDILSSELDQLVFSRYGVLPPSLLASSTFTPFDLSYLEKFQNINKDSLFFKAKMFDQAMSCLRKTWFPNTGSGSQQSDYEISRILAEYTVEFCKFKEKEMDEW